ncbi:pyridoxal phosphate-dependent transferase [Melampsora americana]|nr:pyridoxal phosphate-dependent transferase [Melampsora americana]
MAQEIDYENKFFSKSGKGWKNSGIRGLMSFEQAEGMISFLAGKPDPATFPFESIKFTLKQHIDYRPGPDQLVPEVLEMKEVELDAALQYANTSGIPALLSWFIGLQKLSHHRGDHKQEGWRCSVGTGSQELMHRAFQAICDSDDSILLETPTYAGVLGFLRPLGANLIELPTDADGIMDQPLQSILENWHTDQKTKSLKFPKAIYTCPTGSNPTGATASLDRKKKILSLIRKFDLLLLEDDAYYYLHFDPPNRAPSYFELEKSEGGQIGRVLRFDTMSKIMSPGMRLGFVTGPAKILDMMDLQTASINMQTSTFTQAIAFKVLSHWGYERFFDHCHSVAKLYERKSQSIEKAARRHLDGLADWSRPRAGMFLWLKLEIAKAGEEAKTDSKALMMSIALRNGILAVPGCEFMPSGKNTVYVRISFSAVDEKTADEGLGRLARTIREARKEIGLDS